jgi:hypothetical protein
MENLSDYEKGVRDTIQRIGSEIDCINNGSTPYLTEEKILKPNEIKSSKMDNKTTGEMLKMIQNQIENITDSQVDEGGY